MLEPTMEISHLTKEIMNTLIGDGTSERLIINVPGIGEITAKKIFENSGKILENINNNKVTELKNTLGPKSTENFLEHVYMGYVNLMDAKVTVDTKRILRLPSSLHSKISMKCVEIKDIENFDPKKDAFPEFRSGEK
jgi:DNA primase catalytic subunit